jgi:ribosomal protein S18 acetylase RimI-like enzyme
MSLEARPARPDELGQVAVLLDRFNREYDEPTPGPEPLARRLAELEDTEVLVIGEPICGLAVLRFRRSLWTPGLECYLAELYIVPGRRGAGMGRALMEAVLELARERGADYIELNTDEGDTVARALYESLGFAGTAYYYEREL